MLTGPYLAEMLVKAVTLVIMLVGMLTLPILPGLVIIWVAAVGYGLVTGFSTLGWVVTGILTVLMLVGSIVDNIIMGSRAHKEGAPWWAILLAMLAAIAGSFIIPIPIVGGIMAALLTLFVIEYLRLADWRRALAAMKGLLIGWGWAFGIRLIIGIVMIGLWLVWATL